MKLYLESDRYALSILPERKFVGATEEFRKVSSDCLISYDGNRYSVPHIFACREVWIRISQGRYLKIFSQSNKEIATHIIAKDVKGKIFMNNDHYQGYRGTKGTWSFLCNQFLKHCPGQEGFLESLKAQKRINPSRHLTKIVEAVKHFKTEDIQRVIDLCQSYNLYNGDFFVELLHQEATPAQATLSIWAETPTVNTPPEVTRSLDSYSTSRFANNRTSQEVL